VLFSLKKLQNPRPTNNTTNQNIAAKPLCEYELNRSSTIYDKFVTIKFVAKLKIATRKYPAEKGR
jgi:hypothetical protein